MVGRPKTRAKRLEKERLVREAAVRNHNAAPHTVPPEPVDWQEEGEPLPEIPQPKAPTPEPGQPISEEDAVAALVGGMQEQDKLFNELRQLALENARDILKIQLDADHKDFMKLVARKTSILSAVVTATVRVEANALRGRARNKYDQILAEIAEEARKHGRPN